MAGTQGILRAAVAAAQFTIMEAMAATRVLHIIHLAPLLQIIMTIMAGIQAIARTVLDPIHRIITAETEGTMAIPLVVLVLIQ